MKPDDDIAHGIQTGGRAGASAGGVYLLFWCVLVLLTYVPDLWDTEGITLLLRWVSILPGIIAGGVVVGMLPATGIGMLTGGVIAGAQRRLLPRLTLRRSRVLGGGICGVIALLVHVGWWSVFGTPSGLASIVVVSIPSVIYVGLGFWLSGRLFQQTSSQRPGL